MNSNNNNNINSNVVEAKKALEKVGENVEVAVSDVRERQDTPSDVGVPLKRVLEEAVGGESDAPAAKRAAPARLSSAALLREEGEEVEEEEGAAVRPLFSESSSGAEEELVAEEAVVVDMRAHQVEEKAVVEPEKELVKVEGEDVTEEVEESSSDVESSFDTVDEAVSSESESSAVSASHSTSESSSSVPAVTRKVAVAMPKSHTLLRDFDAERKMGVLPKIPGVVSGMEEVDAVLAWGIREGVDTVNANGVRKVFGRGDITIQVSFPSLPGGSWVPLVVLKTGGLLMDAISVWGTEQASYRMRNGMEVQLSQVRTALTLWARKLLGEAATPKASARSVVRSSSRPKVVPVAVERASVSTLPEVVAEPVSMTEEERVEKVAFSCANRTLNSVGGEALTSNEHRLINVWENPTVAEDVFKSTFRHGRCQAEMDTTFVPLMVRLAARALIYFQRPSVEVRRSKLLSRITRKEQIGLFATEDIPRDTFVTAFVGRFEWVSKVGRYDLSPVGFPDRPGVEAPVLRGLPKWVKVMSKGAHDIYHGCVNPRRALSMGQVVAMLGGSLANHGGPRLANCWFSIAARSQEVSHYLPPVLESLRDIKAGEEILVNYGETFADLDLTARLMMGSTGDVLSSMRDKGGRVLVLDLQEPLVPNDILMTGREPSTFVDLASISVDDPRLTKFASVVVVDTQKAVLGAFTSVYLRVEGEAAPGEGVVQAARAPVVDRDGEETTVFISKGSPVEGLRVLWESED